MREALVSIDRSGFADLGIDELVALFRAADIRDFEELACHGNSSVVQVEVESPVDEALLHELDYVAEWEHVSKPDGTHLYVVAFYAPALSEEIADEVAALVGTCDPELGDDGATMSLVGSQDAISGTLREYQRDGVSPELRKLGGYEGHAGPLDELTDRQREVIQVAYDMGYYEVPREVSTADVAGELDVDPSTVAEHLQRAERNLLAHHLSSHTRY